MHFLSGYSIWVNADGSSELSLLFLRACLKNHSYHLHAPLCVIFMPNSGYIARYAPFIWHKSPTNCDAHLAESIFQTRSRAKRHVTLNKRYVKGDILC